MNNVVHRGFTIIELMIVMTLLAILMSLALPAINNYLDKKRLIAGAEGIYSVMQYARIEALTASSNLNIATSGGISVNFSRVDNDTWAVGTSVNTGCDTGVTDPTAADACYLIEDDGDDTVDGVDSNLNGTLDVGTEVDTGDRVLKVLSSDSLTGVNLTALPDFDPDGGSTSSEITFSSVRGTTVNSFTGTIFLESDDGAQLRVTVGVLGQVNICSPSGTNYVSGYTTC